MPIKLGSIEKILPRQAVPTALGSPVRQVVTPGVSFESELSSYIGTTEASAPSKRLAGESSTNLEAMKKLSRQLFGSDSLGSMSEEQLFAVTIYRLIQNYRPKENHAENFIEQVRKNISSHGSQPSYEKASKDALLSLYNGQQLSAHAVNSIYSKAFYCSQLDGRPKTLFDGIGGFKDYSIAVASKSEALVKANAAMAQLEAGQVNAPRRNLFNSF